MNNKTITIILILLAITLYILMPGIIKSNNDYNKYSCATQGLDATCSHELPVNDRLK